MTSHRAARRLPRVGGRPSRRLLVVLVVVLTAAGTTWFSGASFTSASNTLVTVGAAADYYPPAVTVFSPGAVVSGTVQVTATSTDSASAITGVRIERSPAGSTTWTPLCTDNTSPYACPFDTTQVADGDYQLRAIATDAAGFSATSQAVTTRVANAANVVLSDIAAAVRGTVSLSATVTGAGNRTVSNAFQFRVVGATGWTTVSGCGTVTGTTPTCSWNTTGLTDEYDVRVVSTVGTGTPTVVTDQQSGVVVDNIAPSVSVAAPSPMSGTVQVTATAVDEDSGVAKVDVSYRLVGTTPFLALCTVSTDPYRCSLDTTKLNNGGSYELRAVATDAAGNTTTSALITRQVVNGLASVTITSPLTGDQVRGTITITTDTSVATGLTVTEVVVEGRLAGGTYAPICTDGSAPYTCPWATAGLTSGSWELRAVMTYSGGLTATSPVVTVTIDNTPLRALDIQARNGGTNGLAGAGDTFTFTYQGSVNLTTIKSGWNGTSTSTSVTLSDKAVATATTFDRGTFGNLGTVTFAQNYVNKNKSVTIPATMTAVTSTTGGTTTTVVTVVLGSLTSSDLRTSTNAGVMRWTPLASVQSTGGVACSTTTAVESGTNDSDL